MKYLNTADIESIPWNWNDLIDQIENAVHIHGRGNFSQPIKPYLRYNDLGNRIIAMPAYLGENVSVAGIKWIASFPKNIETGIPRAHSTIILNEHDTGIPFAVLNTPVVSGLRTAAVTGCILRHYLEIKETLNQNLIIGITGFGPIGILHLKMLDAILKDRVAEYRIFDVKKNLNHEFPWLSDVQGKVIFCDTWQDAFNDADIFCTCTVSKNPYVNVMPKRGSIHLNISLRDYEVQFANEVDVMIIDDWEEVCRENTDIENMYNQGVLTREDCLSISEFLITCNKIGKHEVTMFNPMGMAIFDLAIAKYLYRESVRHKVGTELER